MNLKSKSIVEIVKHERKLTYFAPVVCRCQHEITINDLIKQRLKSLNRIILTMITMVTPWHHFNRYLHNVKNQIFSIYN